MNKSRSSLLLAAALGVGSLLGVAPATATVPRTTARADVSVEVWCDSDPLNGDGTGPGSVTLGVSGAEDGVEDDVLAKRVDGRAIQLDKTPGGKDTATERYNETAGLVQGWFCAEMPGV
jgi:hypothetical protein